MLSKQLQEQIEQEAKSIAADFNYYPGSSESEDLESTYVTAASKYAEKWEAAEGWKKEANMLLDPLLEWWREQKDLPLGVTITVELLRRAKLYAEHQQRIEQLETALEKIKDQAVFPKTENEAGVALYNILKLCEEATI